MSGKYLGEYSTFEINIKSFDKYPSHYIINKLTNKIERTYQLNNLHEYIKSPWIRLEDCFAYCEPGEEPIVFSGGSNGSISYKPKGNLGRWHDKFYIPDGETETLSELREKDRDYEAKFWELRSMILQIGF